MNPVREAIGTLLSEDSELEALAPGGVHLALVGDQNLTGPFCIFNLVSATETWAMGSAGLENEMWQVMGSGTDGDSVEDIDLRCREILDGALMTGDGRFTRRTEGMNYTSLENGVLYFYRGSQYRVVIESA